MAASSAVILRVTLLEERRGRPRAGRRWRRPAPSLELGREAGLEVGLGRQVDQALRLAHGERAAGGDLLADRRSPGATASPAGTTSWTRPIRSASSASSTLPVRISSLARAGPTTRGRRCVPPAPGRHREAHLGQPEPGALRGDPEVAAQRELQPAAERVALDRGDRRHRQRGQAPRDAGLELEPLAAARAPLGLELADVRAGRERPLAAARHDDRPDVAGRGGRERRRAPRRARRAARASRG